jgi:hypothetical protein
MDIHSMIYGNWTFNYEELLQVDNNPQRMSAVIDFLFSRLILPLRPLESALDIPYKAAVRHQGTKIGILSFTRTVRASQLNSFNGWYKFPS